MPMRTQPENYDCTGRPGRFRHARALLAALLPGMVPAIPTQSLQPVNEEPIVLPEYRVFAYRPDMGREQWSYATYKGVEVISCADDSITAPFLKYLRGWIDLLELTAPGYPELSLDPFHVIIHTDGPTKRELYKGVKRAHPHPLMFVEKNGRANASKFDLRG